MKKILLTVIFSTKLLFGYVYSSEIEDGINPAFIEYDNFIRQQNQTIKQKYNRLKSTTIKDILENQKIKELHFRNITILNIENNVDKGNLNQQLEKFKQLKNKQGDK